MKPFRFLIAAMLVFLPGTLRAQPTLTSTSPVRNSSSAPASGPVSATFSTAMSLGTASNFRVQSSYRGRIAGAYSGGSTATLLFTPTATLRAGESVRVTLTTGLTDTGSTPLLKPYVYDYRVAAAGGNADFTGQVQDFGAPVGFAEKIAIGDLNGDGALDVVVISRSGRNAYFLGDSQGNLAIGGFFGPNTEDTRGLALGDIDNDGDLDIVCGGPGNFKRTFFNSNGVFTAGPTFDNLWQNTQDLALADLDGDGDLDCAVANGGSAQQSKIYLNDGTGNFSWVGSEKNWGSASADSRSMALGDFDGDYDVDLIAGQMTGELVYFNDGAGNFSAGTTTGNSATRGFAVGDLDGDGDLDLIDDQGVVLRNNGAGAFSVFGSLSGGANSVALGDLDGDGDLDAISTRDNLESRAFLNNGFAVFTPGNVFGGVTTGAKSSALADLDGDGDLDAIIGSYETNGKQSRTYFNNNFQPPPALDLTNTRNLDTAGLTTSKLLAADINGDTFPDIVCANLLQQNVIYINSGTGTFSTVINWGTGSDRSRDLAVADFDGDSDLDIAVCNENSQSRVYFNTAGTFNTFADVGGASDWGRSILAGDLDGDTDIDLVLTATPGTSYVYRNNGSGTFTQFTALATSGANLLCAALGDLDGDTDLDIVIGTELAQNQIHFNAGNATFPAVLTFDNNDSATYGVAVADMDNDSDLDIVAVNAWSSLDGTKGFSRVFWNNGAGLFTTSIGFADGTGTGIGLALTDMNGDGFRDICVGYDRIGLNWGQNWVFMNDGQRRFNRRVPFGPGTDYTWGLAVADFDNDSDRDIAAGNANNQINVLYLNGTTPLAITTSPSLPSAPETVLYQQQISAQGGTAPYTWSISGAPGWLSIGLSTGLLSGTPPASTAPANIAFTVTVNDSASGVHGVMFNFNIVPLPLLVVSTNPLANARSVPVGGNISAAFNQNISTPTAANFIVRGSLSGRRAGAYLGAGTATATIDPSANFMPGELLEAELLAGMPSQAGPLLQTTKQWRFFAATPAAVASYATDVTVQAGITFVPLDLQVGDLDGDGDLDIVIAFNQTVRVYANLGGGFSFVDLVMSGAARALKLCDADNDGDLDLAVAITSGTNQLYYNNGAGVFAGSGIGIGSGGVSIDSADFNGDGWPDFVVGNSSANAVILTWNTGGYYDSANLSSTSSSGDACVRTGDFDGDGLTDIVLGTPNLVRVFRNGGLGSFTPSSASVTGTPLRFAVGDLDGDGDLDVCMASLGSTYLLLGNGAGALGTPTSITGASNDVALLDADGDQDLDIIVFSAVTGQGEVRLNVSGSFTTTGLISGVSGGGFARCGAIGDFDGNGKPDIAGFWYNLGPGTAHVSLLIQGSHDNNSTFGPGPLTEPSIVDSLVGQNYVQVLDFSITDLGTTDGKPTTVFNLSFSQTGTADATLQSWLVDGPGVSVTGGASGAVGSQQISFGSTGISVPDGQSRTYTLSLRLSSAGGIPDGSTFVLSLNLSGYGDPTGSSFAPAQTPVTNGAGLALSVTATQLRVTVQPPPVAAPNTGFNLGVAYTDANGYVDGDVNGDVVTLTRSDAGVVTAGTATAANGVAQFTAPNQVVLGSPEALGIHLVARDDTTGTVNLFASPVSTNNFDLYADDADSTLTAGPLAEPNSVDSVTGAAAPLPVLDFTISDLGGPDGRPTVVTAIVASLSGSTADAMDGTWTLSGPDVASATGVVSGVLGAQQITFSGLSISVAQAASETYTLSLRMQSLPAGTLDGQIYAIALAAQDFTLGTPSTSFDTGQLVSHPTGLSYDVTATRISVSQPPTAIQSVNTPFSIAVEFRDVAGNLDLDVNGDVVSAIRSDAGSVISGQSLAAVNGVANFSGAASIILGGPPAASISLTLTDDAAGTVDLSLAPISSSPFTLQAAGASQGGNQEGEDESCSTSESSGASLLWVILPLLLLLYGRRTWRRA